MAGTTTEIVAWWGAILSSIVFIWDVIKWRLAGPKLRLRVNSGMKSFNIPAYEGKMLITANVVNYGDRPTTVTHLSFRHYKNLWDRMWDRSENEFWIANPNIHVQLPHELKPGTMWDGIAFQDELLEASGKDRYVICAVYHTHRKHPVKKRVKIKDRASRG